ncbi:MAG: DNA polymerase III subunit delta' [Candidatus Omnitrophota bacterium]
MAFADIKGQEAAIAFLRNCFGENKLAHAYLFCGPQGVGKRLFALNLAKFLNCENPLQENGRVLDCCDQCASCRKIEARSHPDVHWIEPQGRAQTISIDDIRLVQKEASLKPYEGRYKVFVIARAEDLTEEAANSLLKVLEEPPAGSQILLTSSDSDGLLPTIISRCQIIKFYPLSLERLLQILLTEYTIQPQRAKFLSAYAQGRIGQALLLNEEDAFRQKNLLIDRVSAGSSGGNAQDIFASKDKQKLETQLGYLVNWFRDILLSKTGLREQYLVNSDRLDEIQALAKTYSFAELESSIERILRTHRLIERNVNVKVALEVMREELAQCSTK